MTAEDERLRAKMLPVLDGGVERGRLTRDEAFAVLDLFARLAAAEATVARVRVVVDGRHRLAYCSRDGDAYVDLLHTLRAALDGAS